MAVALLPGGVKCNLQCGYCYEEPLRDAGNLGGKYDVAAMKAAVLRDGGGPFLMFGGEPLLVPKAVLADLWSWGYEHWGSNVVQTNGVLIDEEHIELFRKYKVRVGISIDGPGALNDARLQGGRGGIEKTRESTRRTEQAIERLCAEKMAPSLIVILHKLNATAEKLSELVDWFGELAALGVRKIGLHLLEVESELARRRYALSAEENVAALLALYQARSALGGVEFGLLNDIVDLLRGDDSSAACIWRACDPYTTQAVKGISGQGERVKCGRVAKDGVDALRSDTPGFERYIALYHTPQEAGGCQGCRFFAMCRGHCPGTAIGSDWRNRSDHCPIWMRLFEVLEGEMLRRGEQPFSISPDRKFVEESLVSGWLAGRNPTMAAILAKKSAVAQR